jgi:LPXTG-motif cell wall-anchored protein
MAYKQIDSVGQLVMVIVVALALAAALYFTRKRK